MLRVIVIFLLLVSSFFLFWLNKSNNNQDSSLSSVGNISSIVSLILALIVFIWPQPFNSLPVNLENEKQAVKEVINKEVKAAQKANLGILKSIYHPNATILSKGGTFYDTSDDLQYKSWKEIEKRYLKWWSLYKCGSMSLVDLSIEIEDNLNKATATHSGVICDGKLDEDIGIYKLIKLDGRWIIVYLESGNK